MLYKLINSHSILPSKLVKMECFFSKRATDNITVYNYCIYLSMGCFLALENVIFSSEILKENSFALIYTYMQLISLNKNYFNSQSIYVLCRDCVNV